MRPPRARSVWTHYFPTGQEDFYVYELDPDDATQYRYGDGYEEFLHETQLVSVRGQPDQTINLRFTRHGPVLHIFAACGRAYVIRTVWTEPRTAAYLASLRYQRADNWGDFVRAQDSWGRLR